MKKSTDHLSFIEQFSTEDQCFAFLVNTKWDKGYTCLKCGHNECLKVITWHHKHCRKCNYDESCTANTLFHPWRFPLKKAFMIIHQLSTMKKGMTSAEIGVQHVLVDLPSVDRELYGRRLAVHKAFWKHGDPSRNECTITEFIFIKNETEDGVYLLEMQIAPFVNDASPSRPVLYSVISDF